MADNSESQQQDLKCPECGAGPYRAMAGLSSHRRSAHNVKGTSPATLTYHKHRSNAKPAKVPRIKPKLGRPRKLPFACPDCSESFDSAKRLGIHRLHVHGIPGSSKTVIAKRRKQLAITPVVSNGHGSNGAAHHQGQEHEDLATQNHIAYAFGRTQQWLELYAAAEGIPLTTLTSGLAALLHGTSRRRILGARGGL